MLKHGFFKVVSTAEFINLLKGFSRLEAETCALERAAGRVLAEGAAAREDLPLLSRSSMDGYAVRAKDVFGASESNPAYLEKTADLAVDERPGFELQPGHCAGIVTGGGLPEGADAVVMVEHTEDLGGGTIEIRKSAAPGDNVMLRGEDAEAGDTALPAGTALRAQEIGLLAALGHSEIRVGKRPHCAILSTGDEVVPIGETPRPGQVRDVNTHALAALVEAAGGVAVKSGLVRDDPQALAQALEKALSDCDAVFVSGGSSVGARDYTLGCLEEIEDSEILAHGVAVSPGKPTILARAGRKAVIGLPGQVTSAQVVMNVFCMPFIRHLMGDSGAFDPMRRPMRPARLSKNVASKPGREDYVRVRLTEDGSSTLLAEPLLGKSGLLTTMIRAQALVRIPADTEGLSRNEEVEAWLI
jgi:molybdopterin molybdotransferase